MATGAVAYRRSTLMARAGEAAQPVRAASRPMPWRADDLCRWVLTAGLGGVVIAVAWYFGAGEATFSQQLGPLDAAVAGLLVSGIGNVAWLLRGRRAVGERRRALIPDLESARRRRRVASAALRPEGPRPPAGAVEAADRLFVAGAGMERFHRPGCALATGRDGWSHMTRAEHERAGRRPCGVCRP